MDQNLVPRKQILNRPDLTHSQFLVLAGDFCGV